MHCIKAELKPRQGSQPQRHADTFLSFSSVPPAKRFIALEHVISSGCALPCTEPKAPENKWDQPCMGCREAPAWGRDLLPGHLPGEASPSGHSQRSLRAAARQGKKPAILGDRRRAHQCPLCCGKVKQHPPASPRLFHRGTGTGQAGPLAQEEKEEISGARSAAESSSCA